MRRRSQLRLNRPKKNRRKPRRLKTARVKEPHRGRAGFRRQHSFYPLDPRPHIREPLHSWQVLEFPQVCKHVGMGEQRFFDFARIDVGAAADDDVLAAVFEGEETFFVERAEKLLTSSVRSESA